MKNMFNKIIVTSILAAASFSTFAQTVAPDDYPVVPFQSTKTRAEVKAELVAAERDGTIARGDDYPILPQATSHKTRAQVLQELVQAERDGTIARGDDYPIIKPAASHKTRAEVEAELVAANSAAPNNFLHSGY